MAEIDLAHQYLSQALVSLVNPYSRACAGVRNSAVTNMRELGEAVSDERPVKSLGKALRTVETLKQMLGGFEAAHEPLEAARLSVGKYLESVAPEPHVAIVCAESDEDDWEKVGSDEEIIVT